MRLSEIRGLLRDRPNADPVLIHAVWEARDAEQERYVRTTLGSALPHSGPAAEVTDDELRAEMRAGIRAPKDAEDLAIARLAREGLLDVEIAEATGIHRKTVARRRLAMGLPSNIDRSEQAKRARAGLRGGGRKPDAVRNETLRRLVADGLTDAVIAERMGTTGEGVRQLRLRLGLAKEAA